jgi:Uma2 family endonuclease
MATKAALSEEEFLRTSFPDVEKEYRDGEVLERSMPNYAHSKAQGRFAVFFGVREKSHGVFPCPELRLRLRTGRYVTPDICVFWPREPQMPVPEILPLIVIEILSPDDKLAEVRDKLQEYRDWGVAHVWLTDPERRIFYVYDHGLLEVPSYQVPELNLEVTPAGIFD